MPAYERVLRPLLFGLSAERAHESAMMGLVALSKVSNTPPALSPRLRTKAMGLTFPSPIGIAAGFDKDARVYRALGRLGFGSVEVGTVTGEGQPGNDRPRLFRLPKDRSLVNRMGFNNAGAVAVAARLKGPRTCPVGINIGKTKRVPLEDAVRDYEKGARALGALADYFVVNVSSPNTPGLRSLQDTDKLRPILVAVRRVLNEVAERHVPLAVKIAPDLSDSAALEAAELALELGLDGLIAANTTISREGLLTAPSRIEEIGAGGLSGPPLRDRSLELLSLLKQRVGDRIALVSVGGVETAEHVFERLRSGASLVQVYTGFVYGGPRFAAHLNRGLLACLDREGLKDVAAIANASS